MQIQELFKTSSQIQGLFNTVRTLVLKVNWTKTRGLLSPELSNETQRVTTQMKAAILYSIESAYGLSNLFPSKPSIVFSPHKPLSSQPNYSSCRLGIFGCIF